MSEVLAYVAAGLIGLWGVAHAIPTRQVVAGFEPITVDNRRVITQEWLAEAFTMWGLSLVVVLATIGSGGSTTDRIYLGAAGLLVALAVLTALTGGRTPVIWFKICPVLLTSSAGLLIAAALI